MNTKPRPPNLSKTQRTRSRVRNRSNLGPRYPLTSSPRRCLRHQPTRHRHRNKIRPLQQTPNLPLHRTIMLNRRTTNLPPTPNTQPPNHNTLNSNASHASNAITPHLQKPPPKTTKTTAQPARGRGGVGVVIPARGSARVDGPTGRPERARAGALKGWGDGNSLRVGPRERAPCGRPLVGAGLGWLVMRRCRPPRGFRPCWRGGRRLLR